MTQIPNKTGPSNKLTNFPIRTKTLIGFMSIVYLLVTGFVVSYLYKTAIEEAKTSLSETAVGYANLIKAVSSFDSVHSRDFPGGHKEATISQVRQAFTALAKNKQDKDHIRQEVILIKKEGKDVVLLLQHAKTSMTALKLNTSSNFSKPVQLALAGEAGIIKAIDYNNVEVLAAYQPLPSLDLGLIVKVDLSGIKQPFYRSATIAIAIALVFILIIAWLYLKLTFPLVKLNNLLKKSEQVLAQEKREKYRQLFDLSIDPMWMICDGKFVEANLSAAKTLGFKSPEMLTETHPSQISPEYQPDGVLSFGKANEMISIAFKKGFHRFEWVHVDKNGRNFHVEVSLTRVPYEDKQGLFCVWRDISERKAAEKQLILSGRVFQDMGENIMITDDKANIIDINPAFCRTTGYTREEVFGQNPRILSSGKQSPTFYRNMWQRIDETGNWQGEVWNRKKGGEIYAELLTISVIKNEFDKVTNYVGMFTDITKSKLQEAKLDLMAHHDILTGLPNRVLFIDRFSQAVAHSKRTKKQLAVCFLDLDDFKLINDQYGHAVGDSLLIEVAKRITDIIREEDTVSRQGGDEFALLLSNIESPANYQQTIERIHASIAKPYLIDGHSHKITTSSGLTLYPDDDGDLDTLLRHADQAMYQSKLKGKNCNHLFDALYEHVTIQKHFQLNEIDQAVTNNEYQLYYQPKVNMATGEVFGAEALLRWIHPEKGLIPPLDFLPTLEGTDLEIKVGDWVIEAALAQLESWKQQGIELEISVNVSSYHLTSDGFIEGLRSALARHSSVDSQFVQIEILESSALGDVNLINSIINDCQEKLGVKAALDDFGTGYSSLTHLRNLPVDTVKIDQSFVRGMLDDPKDYSIIDGIIGLADTFGRNVIAEGVETTNHGLLLLAMGCREAQGYGIAKPMPADDFPLWLERYVPNREWKECGRKTLSTKGSKVKIYDLYSKHWNDLFTKNIQGSQDDIRSWPILNSKKCSCGYWIKEAKKEQLFEEGILILLEKAHKELHEVAQALHLQFQTINENIARENLSGYQRAYNKMRLVFEKCY